MSALTKLDFFNSSCILDLALTVKWSGFPTFLLTMIDDNFVFKGCRGHGRREEVGSPGLPERQDQGQVHHHRLRSAQLEHLQLPEQFGLLPVLEDLDYVVFVKYSYSHTISLILTFYKRQLSD